MKSTGLQYILEYNDNWREILSSEPYNLRIREDNRGRAIFSYSQISSDFQNPIVREARGIIIDLWTNNVVCRAFDKFGNLSENYAPTMDDIDWKRSKVMEKLDGSIIKFWVDPVRNTVQISTNGAIYARQAEIGVLGDFHRLVEMTPEYNDVFDIVSRNPEYTHVFELTSPYNRIVVPYRETHLNYLSSRRNSDGYHEMIDDFQDVAPMPKMYDFTSLEDAISFTQSETFNDFRNEGFVVWTQDDRIGFHPIVKLKTQEYLRVHRLRGESSPTVKNIVPMIMDGEYEEFLAYFPEYQRQFTNIRNKIDSFIDDAFADVQYAMESFDERKEMALWARETMYDMSVLFQIVDRKIEYSRDGVWNYYRYNPKHVIEYVQNFTDVLLPE